jgi:hypothetical protein
MDLTVLDADFGAIQAEWPDSLTYDNDPTPIPCLFEDEYESLVLTDVGPDSTAGSKAHVQTSFLVLKHLRLESKKTVKIASRKNKTYRIDSINLSSDGVETILSLIDPTK